MRNDALSVADLSDPSLKVASRKDCTLCYCFCNTVDYTLAALIDFQMLVRMRERRFGLALEEQIKA